MNRYIQLSLLSSGLIVTAIHGQEKKLPSLRTLALDKVATVLHSELVKPQSPAQRTAILDHYDDQAGILFKPYYTNQKGELAQSTLKNETIVERFEQKYAKLKKIAEFNDDDIKAITHDGSKCVFKLSNKTLAVVDIKTGKILKKLIEHTNWIHHVTITPDNTKTISVSNNKTLKIWDINTGACLHTLVGHTDNVTHVTLTTDNTKAISASDDKTLKIWDINTGACLHTLVGHTHTVTHVTLTTDNTKAISVSWDKTLKVWDLNTGICLLTLTGHTDFVRHVTLTTDNTKAISASDDKTLKVWDIKTGTCLQTLPNENGEYHAELIVHNNLIVAGKSVYQFEDYQSIINRMPQPNPCNKNRHTHSLD